MTENKEERMSLAEAIVAFRAECPTITKSKTVSVQTRNGGTYTFDYAPYEAIIETVTPLLSKYGLALVQPLTTDSEGRLTVHTILIHESGESLDSLTPVKTTDKTDQEVGSSVTYMKRYALSGILGLATDDDDDANYSDGNTATVVSRGGRSADDGRGNSGSGVSGRGSGRGISDSELSFLKSKAEVIGVDLAEFVAEQLGADRSPESLTFAEGQTLFASLAALPSDPGDGGDEPDS